MTINESNESNEFVGETDEKREYSVSAGNIVLVLCLCAAVVINVIPFEAFGLQTRLSGYRTILLLADFGTVSEKTIMHRRGLYLELGKTAPHVNMVLPTGKSIDIAQLYGFGRVSSVQFLNYEPELFAADFDPSNNVVSSNKGDKRLGPGPFAIIVKKRPVDSMILLRRNDTWCLVDTSLLPPKDLERLSQ